MLPIIITAFVCVPAGFLIAGAFLVPNYKAAIEALDKSEANNSYWYNEYKLVRDREKARYAAIALIDSLPKRHGKETAIRNILVGGE